MLNEPHIHYIRYTTNMIKFILSITKTMQTQRIQTRPLLIVVLASICAVTASNQAIGQTFSPYTPAQIQELNSQSIAPVETPAGPMYSNTLPANFIPSQNKSPGLDSRYFSNPQGEEQAQSQETDSAAPFEPIPSTVQF